MLYIALFVSDRSWNVAFDIGYVGCNCQNNIKCFVQRYDCELKAFDHVVVVLSSDNHISIIDNQKRVLIYVYNNGINNAYIGCCVIMVKMHKNKALNVTAAAAAAAAITCRCVRFILYTFPPSPTQYMIATQIEPHEVNPSYKCQTTGIFFRYSSSHAAVY